MLKAIIMINMTIRSANTQAVCQMHPWKKVVVGIVCVLTSEQLPFRFVDGCPEYCRAAKHLDIFED